MNTDHQPQQPPPHDDYGQIAPDSARGPVATLRAENAWLVDQVESLERWKFEACEVMSGLRELGKALGLRPGAQITGPAALAEVARLTAERDALAAAHARESEKVWKVEEVMDDIEGSDPTTWERLRAALAGSDADTGEQETGHKCEPYYSRSECGQCGWQEQWCATCSRQMCGCATGATDQDAMGADQ